MQALPYYEAIRVSTEDLLLNSKATLSILAKSLQLPDNGDKIAVAKLIATTLIDKHWLPERGTMIPERARNCNNPLDLITQEDWSADYLPDTKITFMKKDGSELRTLCLDHDTSTQWLNDDSHNFALWIPNFSWRQQIDSDGHGGGPGKTIVTQLTDRTFVINADVLQHPGDYVAYPIAENARVGNRMGIFGVSMLHGQAPGETIYFLTRTDPHGELVDFLQSTLAARRFTIEQLEDLLGSIDVALETLPIPRILTVLHDIFSERPEITDDYNEGNRVGPTVSAMQEEETSLRFDDGVDVSDEYDATEFGEEDEYDFGISDEYDATEFGEEDNIDLTDAPIYIPLRESGEISEDDDWKKLLYVAADALYSLHDADDNFTLSVDDDTVEGTSVRDGLSYFCSYAADDEVKEWVIEVYDNEDGMIIGDGREIMRTTDGPTAIARFLLLVVGQPSPLDSPLMVARKYEPLVLGMDVNSEIVELEDGFEWFVDNYMCTYRQDQWLITNLDTQSAIAMDSAETAMLKFITLSVESVLHI